MRNHPDCHFRAIKELHFFDARAENRSGREIAKHEREQAGLIERLARRDRAPDEAQAERLRDRAEWLHLLSHKPEMSDWRAYLEFGAGRAKVVGEVTPAYALLSLPQLAELAAIENLKVVYLLRDPVERLWSHVRMIAARRDPEGKAAETRAGRILDRVLEGEETEIVRRSDYAGALKRLTAAFGDDRVHLGVFEEITKSGGLAGMAEFAGLSPFAHDPRPRHAGPELAMTGAQRTAARQWLAPQYQATERALGRRPEAWDWTGHPPT